MLKWLHHLFNPHCEFCRDEQICNSCETLRAELTAVRFENRELLRNMMEMVNPEKQVVKPDTEVRIPINNQLTWRARQQLLESEDRKKAQVIREQAAEKAEGIKTTEELEAELKVAN